MLNQTLFFIVFLGEILLLSYYFPRKMLDRISYVFKHYPPSDYPKLYPKPIEYYEKARRNYGRINTYIMLVGFLLLTVLLLYPPDWKWVRTYVTMYYLVQMLPLLLLEIRSVKYYKLMRKKNTTRKAELHPRHLFDFISPKMIALVVFVYFAFIGFVYYMNQFEYPWFGGFANVYILTAVNLFFAVIIAWKLYGKKQDPYQSYEDRKRHIELTGQQLVFVSIAMTMFIVIEVILASLEMRHFQPTIICVYFQLLAVISFRTLRVDTINFEVYKRDPGEKESSMVEEETTEAEKSALIYTMTGLAFGLSFGIALGYSKGATIVGLMLLGGIGAGIGTLLGIVVFRLFNVRNGTSLMI